MLVILLINVSWKSCMFFVLIIALNFMRIRSLGKLAQPISSSICFGSFKFYLNDDTNSLGFLDIFDLRSNLWWPFIFCFCGLYYRWLFLSQPQPFSFDYHCELPGNIRNYTHFFDDLNALNTLSGFEFFLYFCWI